MQLQVISTIPYNPNAQAVLQVIQIIDPIVLKPIKIEIFSEKGLSLKDIQFALTGFSEGVDNIEQQFGTDYMSCLCTTNNTDVIVNDLISSFDDPDYSEPVIIRLSFELNKQTFTVITAGDETGGLDDRLNDFEDIADIFGASRDDITILDISCIHHDAVNDEDEFEDKLENVEDYRDEAKFITAIDEFARLYSSMFDMVALADYL